MTLPPIVSIASVVLLLSSSFVLAQVPVKTSITEANVKAFLEEEIAFDDYIFPPGQFPAVSWKRPERIERLMGPIPLTVEYYDGSFMRVLRADRPGRYGAVVHGTTANGFSVVRYATLYCSDVDLDDYSPDVPIEIRPLPSFGIKPEQWATYQEHLRRFSFGSLLISPKHDPDVAIFLAGLFETEPSDSGVITPRSLDRLWWTRFKTGRKTPARNSSLRPMIPQDIARLDTALAQHVPYDIGQLRQIRAIGTEWTERSGVPMVACVVYRGTIVFHEAFGRRSDGEPMTPAIPTWMASITKLMTGILTMQFVDRGLVDLDAPIDRYLPELSSSRPCPLTLRILLTHTSGLSWSGEWASDWEPSMENRVAQALPYLTPGRSFKYHRSGYALTSKILERVSNMTVPELFRDMIMVPVGMNASFAENSYGGLYATASDLARFGYVLLEQGRTHSRGILSDSAFQAFLPRPLNLAQGERPRSWGIGCLWLGGDGLSDSTFGHEAASGAILRIDPVNDIVVVVGRDRVGTNDKLYQEFVGRFLKAVALPLITTRGGRRD